MAHRACRAFVLRVVVAGLAATLAACSPSDAPRAGTTAANVQNAAPDVTTAVHAAAVHELFTVRERARWLVYWRDADNRGPVLSRLRAEASLAPLPDVTSASGEALPVDSVSLPLLQALFRDQPDGWKALFAAHPGAPGVVELGRVRHDTVARRASVLVGRSCGERCAMAWLVTLQAARDSSTTTPWVVASVQPLPLPPESPHVRFAGAAQLLQLHYPEFTVLDARSWWAFRRGHLPGAVRVDWRDYRDDWGRTGRLADNLPALSRRLESLGVDSARPVLVYGAAADGWGEEGRIAWMLRYLGHPEVVVLDGGFGAWQRAGGAVSRTAGTAAPGRFVADPQADWRATGGEVEAAAATTVILDTRSEAEWNGSRRHLPSRTGRIPGAVHLHWRELLTEDGLLDRSPASRARLAALGITDSTTVLTYCVAGVRSGFATVALRELGVRDVRNYDGSWYEWSADRARRIASPEAAP